MRFLELLKKEFLHLKKDWGVLIIPFSSTDLLDHCYGNCL
jgi:hypothetical protein